MNSRRLVVRTRHLWLGLCLLLVGEGCVHQVRVSPAPPVAADHVIPVSVQVVVPFLSLEGPDHMPGISSFEWPAQDLRAATIDYLQKRQTFKSAGPDPEAFTLTLKAWLTMKSRGAYRYTLRLESDLGPSGKPPIKSYVTEKEEIGSQVRWTTAADRDPIARAVQAAFDELTTQIEADAPLFRKSSS